jgi:hypothetical protein
VVVVLHDPVVQGVQASLAVERRHATRDRIRVERLAGEIVEQAVESLGVILRASVDLHEVDARGRNLARCVAPLRVQISLVWRH